MNRWLMILCFVVFCTMSCDDDPTSPDYDDFILGDTVAIRIGETLYESEEVWVRLDSIPVDTRVYDENDQRLDGTAKACFTVNNYSNRNSFCLYIDSIHQRLIPKSTDTLIFNDAVQFYMMDVQPHPRAGEHIHSKDYNVQFILFEGAIVKKPNIYLYPEEECRLSVSLGFPQGGDVVISDPPYPHAWQDITVTPEGRIDNTYDYLFYEASVPDLWQRDKGWVISREDLSGFFSENLSAYGFNSREIDDFLEYWIPLLKNSTYYAIYPQHTADIDDVITLNISKTPDSILRLFYVIKEVPEAKTLPEPVIPEFDRIGFAVTEWGVIY
ncbi:hypothetical protein [Fidelibacter multiformis]|uniref:hypothetical protein n=1 Tax=Fidelibacter multiformis TaxID=3377529 RepID=UPI0037DD1622